MKKAPSPGHTQPSADEWNSRIWEPCFSMKSAAWILSIQAKLLQVLQDGTFTRVGAQESRKVNTRLICTANGNLRQRTEDGSFRLDFFFRINAVTIDLPPLRQRAADLPMLIDYFLHLHSKAYRVEPKPLSREITKHDAAIRLAGKHPSTGEHDSRLRPDRQRGGPGGGSDSGYSDRDHSRDRSGQPHLFEGNYQGRQARFRAGDHAEGVAGEWLEPPQNGQVAQYQLPIASL